MGETHTTQAYEFLRFGAVDPAAVLAHLRDPRIARHLPLLPPEPDATLVENMIAAKETCWERDGLGHWAILRDGAYIGWGGFERDQGDWDFGLVLRPAYFSQGLAITAQAFAWARANTAIDVVTFLLPLTRSERALRRLGAVPEGEVEHAGIAFRKWRFSLEPQQASG